MKFILQDNLMNVDHCLQVKYAMDPYPNTCVGVIPFSNEITCQEELVGQDYIPYGSTLLTMLADDLGWKGLFFDLDTFNYRSFLYHRDDMLNDNVMEIVEAIGFLALQDPESEWFVRPSQDL